MIAENSAFSEEFLKENKQKILQLFFVLFAENHIEFADVLQQCLTQMHEGTGEGSLDQIRERRQSTLSVSLSYLMFCSSFAKLRKREHWMACLLFHWLHFFFPKPPRVAKGQALSDFPCFKGSFYCERHGRKPCGFAVRGRRVISDSFLLGRGEQWYLQNPLLTQKPGIRGHHRAALLCMSETDYASLAWHGLSD